MHGLLEQRHLDPALGPELRLHELLHHDADVLRWQRRIELAEYLDSLVVVLVNELGPFATRRLVGSQLFRPLLYCLAFRQPTLRPNDRHTCRPDDPAFLPLSAAGPP